MNEQFKTKQGEKKLKVVKYVERLTVCTGYISFRDGGDQGLEYVEVPGNFDPCISLEQSDKAFAIDRTNSRSKH